MATATDARLFGKSIKRREAPRFITGRGSYADDLKLTGMTYAAFVRSPHAHAKIRKIDVTKAKAHPGVVAIFTGKDRTGGTSLPCGWLLPDPRVPPHPPLASETARYVGDPVAIVIAESQDAALDAAEKVKVDWDVRPAVTATAKAADKGAAQIHEVAPSNVAFKWQIGDRAATDAALKSAPVVVKKRIVNQRLVANAMEPRACVARYEDATGDLTLWVTSQNPHVHRLLMTAFVLGIPEHKVRVIAPDVGGGFGSKIFLYNEETVCSWATRRIKRPIRWTSTRREAFQTDAQGRDHVTDVELALSREGKILGLRVKTVANLGAYLSTFAPAVPTYLYGKLIGIGFSTYIEACSIAPSKVVGSLGAQAGLYESGIVRVHPTGKVTVFTGSHSHGQGHETTFSQLVADELGVPIDDVDIVHGDTGAIAFGMGTYGSRSASVGGTAIHMSIEKIKEKGKKIAAHLLEASPKDMEYVNGQFQVKGFPGKAVPVGQVALTPDV